MSFFYDFPCGGDADQMRLGEVDEKQTSAMHFMSETRYLCTSMVHFCVNVFFTKKIEKYHCSIIFSGRKTPKSAPWAHIGWLVLNLASHLLSKSEIKHTNDPFRFFAIGDWSRMVKNGKICLSLKNDPQINFLVNSEAKNTQTVLNTSFLHQSLQIWYQAMRDVVPFKMIPAARACVHARPRNFKNTKFHP